MRFLFLFLCTFAFAQDIQQIDYTEFKRLPETGWYDKQYNQVINDYEKAVNRVGLKNISKKARANFLMTKWCMDDLEALPSLCKCAANKIEKDYFVNDKSIDIIIKNIYDNNKLPDYILNSMINNVEKCFEEENPGVEIQRSN